MWSFLLRRAGSGLIVLFAASVLIFIGVRALPGDPATALAGEARDPRLISALRDKLGLDEPLLVQYATWIGQVTRGDLGESTATGVPVSEIIASRLPITIELALLSILIAIAVGIPAGVLAAWRPGSVWDHMGSGVALLGLSIPSFWLGLVLILTVSVRLGLLPASGHVALLDDPVANLRHMLLPAVVLAGPLAAVIMRQTRSAMLEALGTDYVRTARAKGLSERAVVWSHALRNSLITVVTVLGLALGALISGAVVIEQIFVVPGFGKLTVDSVLQRDYALIQGVVLIVAVGYVVVNFVVDLAYSWLDPRIRVAGRAA